MRVLKHEHVSDMSRGAASSVGIQCRQRTRESERELVSGISRKKSSLLPEGQAVWSRQYTDGSFVQPPRNTLCRTSSRSRLQEQLFEEVHVDDSAKIIARTPSLLTGWKHAATVFHNL